MSKLRFDIDVHDGDIADEIERRIEDGMEDAVSTRRPDSLGHKIKAAARNHIRAHGRIWTTELLNSFDITAETQGDDVHLVLSNDAGHAAAIDVGAEYGDEGPPLHRLIPWVQSKLKGYRVRGGALVKYADDPGGKTILTDGSGKTRGATLDLPPDLEVESIQSLGDVGVSGGANRNDAYYITFEGGESAYFQEYKDPGDIGGSDVGTVRNELVFTRLSSEEDWRLGPENRAGDIVDPEDNEVIRGNFQMWVDESALLDEEIADSFTPAGADVEYEPPEFMEEHEEWLAKTTVMDIFIGNTDRHESNILIDEDGNPHAIDNGGHFLPSTDGDLDELIPPISVYTGVDPFHDFNEYPELEDAYESMFEAQLEFIEQFLSNHREDILTHFRLIHGENSPVYRRVENLLDHTDQEILDQVTEHQDAILTTRSAGSDIDKVLEQDDVQDINDILDNLEDDLEDI